MEPFLNLCRTRDLREQVWRTYYGRGDNGNAHDNKKIITEILALRSERAQLLGYATHAHWRVADSMAKTPEKAMDLLLQVWPAAVARERQEVADMQRIADAENPGIKIAAWDYRYYAEKVRKAKYDLEMNEVKPYLQLEKLREGMFWAAGQLFGFAFTPVSGLPSAHPDVRVWEVQNPEGGHVGLWYFDPYMAGRQEFGRLMSEYRGQERLAGEHFAHRVEQYEFREERRWRTHSHQLGRCGDPVPRVRPRVAWLEFSRAVPSLAGTNVVRDFVEFPSQLNENWLPTPEVLSRFAVHYRTGRPIPQELAAKIKQASTFNQGFATVEYLASALIDMKLHLAGGGQIDPDQFERETLASLGMPDEVVMRHRTPQFAHIFASDAYSGAITAICGPRCWTATASRRSRRPGGPTIKPLQSACAMRSCA